MDLSGNGFIPRSMHLFAEDYATWEEVVMLDSFLLELPLGGLRNALESVRSTFLYLIIARRANNSRKR